MSQNNPIIIHADRRENSSGIPLILEHEYGIKVLPAMLRTGDYIIDEKIVIERKTHLDFAQSIIDGRLFQQAAMMRKFFNRSLLIVEGSMESISERIKIHSHAVKGALVSIAVAWQISILFSQDAAETALLLWLIGHQETASAIELSYRPRQTTQAPVSTTALHPARTFPSRAQNRRPLT